MLIDPTLTKAYGGIFEGNGFTVSNFTVEKSGSLRPSIAIFDTLSAGAEIRNVSFLSVIYDASEIGDKETSVKAAALAVSSLGAKISNVSVAGNLTTNYTGALDKMNDAVYEANEADEVVNFTANITVNN